MFNTSKQNTTKYYHEISTTARYADKYLNSRIGFLEKVIKLNKEYFEDIKGESYKHLWMRYQILKKMNKPLIIPSQPKRHKDRRIQNKLNKKSVFKEGSLLEKLGSIEYYRRLREGTLPAETCAGVIAEDGKS